MRALVDLSALAEEGDRFTPSSATQYALRDRNGLVAVYGDQQWLADGAPGHPPGMTVLRRKITITYGKWEEATDDA